MPTAETILSWATTVANDWRGLAIAWHVALAALLLAFARGWRPSPRVVAVLLVLPVISVSVLASVSWNPFNGVAFAVLAILLMRGAMFLPKTPVTRASPVWLLAGVPLVALGWAYPHFLRTATWTSYLYASPFGLLPCPTLLVISGITLIFGGARSLRWCLPLLAADLIYGLIGVLGLRVLLDIGLFAGTVMLAVIAADLILETVRASDEERTRALPGDELISPAVGTLTHAITMNGPSAAVWPWLVQMGAGSRAGWYSYDVLDNGRQPSAARIVPELQSIRIGTLFPALPGVSEGFVVLGFQPLRWLLLGFPNADGSPAVTWAFVLEPCSCGSTRLLVRARGGHGYRFRGLPAWLSIPVIRLVHFVMQRKQLREIARRVEASSRTLREAA